jgi:hypothetical protein
VIKLLSLSVTEPALLIPPPRVALLPLIELVA